MPARTGSTDHVVYTPNIVATLAGNYASNERYAARTPCGKSVHAVQAPCDAHGTSPKSATVSSPRYTSLSQPLPYHQ